MSMYAYETARAKEERMIAMLAWTDDPVRDAEAYAEACERAAERYDRPYCNVCMEPIYDSKCYVMDDDSPFESCVCEHCVKRQAELFIDPWLRDDYENHMYDLHKDTPVQALEDIA